MALRRQCLVHGRHNAPGGVTAVYLSSRPATSAPACVPGSDLAKPGLVRGDTSVGEGWSMVIGL